MEEANVKNVYVGGNRKNSLINQKMICRILGFLLFIEGVMLLVCAGDSGGWRAFGFLGKKSRE